ncbi:MAG: HPr family phosphocarrier protein [Candidatus Sumerlaeia bacterium]|nr:HPr family phosphocarrier protein [Candidatus Sumerlaeia bacterium]
MSRSLAGQREPCKAEGARVQGTEAIGLAGQGPVAVVAPAVRSVSHPVERVHERGQALESTRTEIRVTITNRQGLHARPAAQFVRIAGQYPDCEVTVSREGMSVNGKSIMGMMMLAAGPGTELSIVAEGDGAEEICRSLKDLVSSGFGEERSA